jgi:hypothetical protein
MSLRDVPEELLMTTSVFWSKFPTPITVVWMESPCTSLTWQIPGSASPFPHKKMQIPRKNIIDFFMYPPLVAADTHPASLNSWVRMK